MMERAPGDQIVDDGLQRYLKRSDHQTETERLQRVYCPARGQNAITPDEGENRRREQTPDQPVNQFETNDLDPGDGPSSADRRDDVPARKENPGAQPSEKDQSPFHPASLRHACFAHHSRVVHLMSGGTASAAPSMKRANQ